MRDSFNITVYRDVSDGLKAWDEVRFWLSDSPDAGIVVKYSDTGKVKIDVSGEFDIDEAKRIINEVEKVVCS